MIIKKFKKTGLALLCLSVGSIGSNAYAASVTATASITDLHTTLLTLSNDQYLSDASTLLQNGFDASSVLQSYYFNDSDVNGNASFASIDNTIAPLPQTSAGATGSGLGTATVLWTFDWLATGTGTATLDLEYLYNASVFNYSPGETAIASSSLSVILDGTSTRSDTLYSFYNVADSTSGFINKLLNFDVVSGESGTFTVALTSVANVAPVPLPASLSFLLTGLMGMVGFVRRRRIQAA